MRFSNLAPTIIFIVVDSLLCAPHFRKRRVVLNEMFFIKIDVDLHEPEAL